jgi:hypothetical protein
MIEQVTSYTELIAGIEAARTELGIKQRDFDDLAGFAAGSWGKAAGLLGVRQLRLEYMFAAIRAAGLRLRIEVDPEQRAKMLTRIADNYNPRTGYQARNGHAASLPSTPVLNRVMQPWRKIGGKKRWAGKSEAERSAHCRAIANQRWVRHRKRVAAGKKGAKTRKQRLALMPPPQTTA